MSRVKNLPQHLYSQVSMTFWIQTECMVMDRSDGLWSNFRVRNMLFKKLYLNFISLKFGLNKLTVCCTILFLSYMRSHNIVGREPWILVQTL